MKSISNKIIASLILCFCMFSLYGCGKADLGMTSKINENGSGEIVIIAALSGVFAQQAATATTEESTNAMLNAFNLKGKNIKTETTEANGIKTTKITFVFNNLDELNNVFKDVKDTDFKINVEKKVSLFKTQYVYTIKLPANFNVDAMMKELEKDPSVASNQLIDKNTIASFIGSAITVKNTLTIPGKLITSNATKTEQNTLTWDYAFSQLRTNEAFTATYEVANKVNISIAAAGAVLVFGIGFFALIRRKKTNS
jgi:hypothetical protein